MARRWTGQSVSMKFALRREAGESGDTVFDEHEHEHPELIPLVGEDGAILTIDVEATGQYDPGVTYGPMDGSYPPEGENEVKFVSAEVGNVELNKDVAERVYARLAEQVEDLCWERMTDY